MVWSRGAMAGPLEHARGGYSRGAPRFPQRELHDVARHRLMADPPVRHERIEGDGLQLPVARAGEGPPVILLHGFPENWTSWRHQIAPLVAAGYSVMAPDLRGYGRSDRPSGREAYHLRHLVEDVAA